MPISKILLATLIIVPILFACNKGDSGMTANTLITAPDFSLIDENNQTHTLSDYKDQYVLIYFYPKDDTPGCTKEACSIRDSIHRFESKNIKVFGISSDSPASHKKFKNKYQLPFTLLSDQKKEVAKLYHADGILLKRISYLIAPGGTILKHYPDVSPSSHAGDILDDFDAL
ncbi:MAG: peroxiredoxin [Cyanobacteria bacterium]|nr:peroxiredoxin [Cyanobacteriota bacterium]MDA1021092.1 peroxiredoxin [Cyanobacteriota bacterium]